MPSTHPDHPWLHTPALVYGVEIFEPDAATLSEALTLLAFCLGASEADAERLGLDELLGRVVPEWSRLRLSWSQSQSAGRWILARDEPGSASLDSCVFGLELFDDIDRLPVRQARTALRSKAPARARLIWREQIEPFLRALGIEQRFGSPGAREIAIWDGGE